MLAVAGLRPARLLLLDDDPADLPVRLDHRRVDRLPGPGPRQGEDLADLRIDAFAATARRIGPERLGVRIEADGLPVELSDQARTFNVMLDRLQGSFDRLERFSGDIAHELRTPVHAIRDMAEVSLTTSRTRDEDREAPAACPDSAEQLSQLFDRFYRPDPARSAGQGVGLGLAIVKSIAELHVGRASISSRVGEGTVVTLQLPAARDDENVMMASSRGHLSPANLVGRPLSLDEPS